MLNYSGTRGIPRIEVGRALMEYMLMPSDFIGTRVLPIFNSVKKTANYPKITRESLNQAVDAKRAAGSNYNRSGIKAEDGTFACEEYGLEDALDDSQRALYASDFDAEFAIGRGVAYKLQIEQEKRIATEVFNTALFTGASLYTDNSGTPWDAAGTGVIAQVDAAKEKVRLNTGMRANSVVMSETNFIRLKANTEIRAAIQYTARTDEETIRNAIADLFGVSQVLIAGSVKNSANSGQTFSGSDIWSDDYVMVAKLAMNGQDLMEPGLGRSFLWTEDSPENVVAEMYRDDKVRSDILRVRQHVDEVIVDKYFGHLMKVDA